MSDLLKKWRLKARLYRLRTSQRLDGLRLWWLEKKHAYLQWRVNRLETKETVMDSREFMEGDNE